MSQSVAIYGGAVKLHAIRYRHKVATTDRSCGSARCKVARLHGNKNLPVSNGSRKRVYFGRKRYNNYI